MKKNVMIRIDEELVSKAKTYGLNISKISANALKDVIRRLDGSKPAKEPNCDSNDYG